ncbi:dipeptidase [Pseudoflavonifractor phocaeensis]|uniref:dipeptidase n=1 Tax=Pseudoflavonifractor phocaeensis TaxID=1870988 RepID=UPI0019569475|nr:dipeptidase [Pseudoflavonifractor phocaeensis]MBM6869609.1 dipeptidase [Pseudoflavonifractor phocaeensis]
MKKEMTVFDGHCDTILRCYERGGGIARNGGHLDLERMEAYGHYAQFFAIFADRTTRPGMPLHQVFREEYDLFRRELEKNRDRVVLCRTGGQVEEAWRGGRSAALLSAEGAELLDCSTELLEEAHGLGVRAVNLTWNHANALSGSNAEERDRGLSAQGRAFVDKMERLGMLVDVSHLSDRGFWDVAQRLNGPFFASHSNARALCPDARNLTDEMFTAIIEHNGVAGLNVYAGFLGDDPNLDTVISHLEHFLDLGGEKNVSLGGDWDGCSQLPRGLTGIQELDRLYERLLQRNYSTALLDAVFNQNLMRVVNEVCTM